MAPSINPVLRKRLLALAAAGGAVAMLGGTLDYFEGGSQTTAFRDMGGVLTICRGITRDVHAGQVVTVEECKRLDDAEALRVLAKVDAAFVKRQPDFRRVAFADFAYNVGDAAFLNSTARRMINRGQLREGCDQLNRWVYVRGRVIDWQVQRRAFERELCLDGVPI